MVLILINVAERRQSLEGREGIDNAISGSDFARISDAEELNRMRCYCGRNQHARRHG